MIAQTVERPASPPAAKPAASTSINFMKEWNDRTPSQRKKLMQDAGYQAHHHWSHRAWKYIPFSIREDVITVIKKQKRASTPTPAAQAQESSAPVRKPYWWEEKAEAGDE